jgi:hypothetical protein
MGGAYMGRGTMAGWGGGHGLTLGQLIWGAAVRAEV